MSQKSTNPPIEEATVEFRFRPGQEWDLTRPGKRHQDPESRKDHESTHCFRQIEAQMMVALEREPVEDGCSHPAEAILEKLIQDPNPHESREWILRSLFHSDRWNPSSKAEIVRLLGQHREPFTKAWRQQVIQEGLSSPSLEMRDASVQTAELWSDQDFKQILKDHKNKEKCSWLADYIDQVIQDLEM